MKVVGDVAETDANIVGQERTPNSRKSKKNMRRRQQQGPRRGKECDNCGYQHPENQDSCTTIGKECLKCGKRNDFISRCKSKEVKATELEDEDSGEIYQTEVAAVKLDDSQLVTLKLSLVTLFGSNLIPEPNVTWCHYTSTKRPQKTKSWKRWIAHRHRLLLMGARKLKSLVAPASASGEMEGHAFLTAVSWTMKKSVQFSASSYAWLWT